MNRQEINEAIRRVITSKFKKNAPASFDMVQGEGYEIYKFEGSFKVKNPKTGRVISHAGAYRRAGTLLGANHKFDYVGFLEKPINTEWQELQRQTQGYPKPIGVAQNAYFYVWCAKSGIKSEDERIKRYKEDIADLMRQIERKQNDILSAMTSKQKCEQKLEEERAKLRDRYEEAKKGA